MSNKNSNYGTPWKMAGKFDSFEQADNKRSTLQENNENMQVKVRRRDAEKCFSVHYRSPEAENSKTSKKKQKKKEKKGTKKK
jgi:hypothetical protein